MRTVVVSLAALMPGVVDGWAMVGVQPRHPPTMGALPQALQSFMQETRRSLQTMDMSRLRLSDRRSPSLSSDTDLHELRTISARLVNISAGVRVQIVYSYATNDVTKNYSPEEAFTRLEALLLPNDFRMGVLHTSEYKYEMNLKRGGGKFRAIRKEVIEPVRILGNDQPKHHLIPMSSPFLQRLNVTTADNRIKVNMAAKYNQIQKFVEIMNNLVQQNPQLQRKLAREETPPLRIIDMGCGLGYLTFACHDFFNTQFQLHTIGVESRLSLVNKVNAIARDLQMEGLEFVAGTIDSFSMNSADILIALHACDTASDEAILKGIRMKSEIIVVAPCCQKEVRRQLETAWRSSDSILKESELTPMISHGIYRERLSEMVTDTARALLLEIAGYQTNVFEFVGGEHTVILSFNALRSSCTRQRM